MRVIEQIAEAFHSPDNLHRFINGHAEEIFAYFNATQAYLNEDKELWYNLILRHRQELQLLDYDNQYVRAFLTYLLDIACRFGHRAAVTVLMPLVRKHHIIIGYRLEADCLRFYPAVTSNSDLVRRFGKLCDLLQNALDNDEADSSQIRAALLRYYAYALENTLPEHIDAIRTQALDNIGKTTVLRLATGEIQDSTLSPADIQALADDAMHHNDAPVVATDLGPEMIETGTRYTSSLEKTHPSFAAIQDISKEMALAGSTMPGRGEEIIDDDRLLLTYMRNYGYMHFAKIESALQPPFPRLDKKYDVIDWGCGQAIATMAVIETLGSDNINMIILIEPSELAIKRAAANCRKLCPDTPIVTICRDFDKITRDNLPPHTSKTRLNIFSNVLDLDTYSMENLIAAIEDNLEEENYFVCASPAKSEPAIARMEAFRAFFSKRHSDTYRTYHDITNSSDGPYWMCNARYKGFCHRHGDGMYCKSHNADGCYQKWTRVLKVFSI